MSRIEFQISDAEAPEVNNHLGRMTGPESKGKSPAHYAAEFLADEGNIERGARANGKAVFLLLEAWIPSIDALWEVLPAALELKRRMDAGTLQELGPGGMANRTELIGLVKEFRQFLVELSTCSDPGCAQDVCRSKRDARARIENLFVRMGVK